MVKVKLINWTKDAIETMCFARRVMHSPVPDSLGELIMEPEKWLGMSVDDYVNKILLNDGMPTFLEYINLTFKLEGVSRALQQQLTRHRIGFSYSIQSLRCVDLPNFADDFAYHNPAEKDTNEYDEFEVSMQRIQSEYRDALKTGISIQDARGLLPMNIHSTITFSCNLRALIGMLNKRLCLKTQGEFRDVADLIKKEIEEKIDKRILKWIGPPCVVNKYCIMKGENEEQIEKGLMTGVQNTDHVCPLYLKLFKDGLKQ